MLDANQPHDVFSGKDDLYKLLRETRAVINALMVRVEAIEVMLRDDEVVVSGIIDEGDAEESMANTKGNSGMVPKIYGRKGGKKK